MSDLKTELVTKVLPHIPSWTEHGPDNPEIEQPAPKGKTQLVYDSVMKMQGAGSTAHAKALVGVVPESSVASLLAQLVKRGYLRTNGERPMKFFTTEKEFVPGPVEEKVLDALRKANEARHAKLYRKDGQRKKKPGRKPGMGTVTKEEKMPMNLAWGSSGANTPVERTEIKLPPTMFHKITSGFPRTAKELVSELDVRTAREVYDELKALFG